VLHRRASVSRLVSESYGGANLIALPQTVHPRQATYMATKPATRSDWNTEEMPIQKATLAVERLFSREEMTLLKQGVVPEAMEDKWFIFHEGDRLYFHRSWTGFCIYIVRFEERGDRHAMVNIEANRDPEQYNQQNDKYDVQMLSYLIDALLLGQSGQFPVLDPNASPEINALQQWSIVGRTMLKEPSESENTPRREL